MKRYYQITTNGREADINIYGDIISWEWYETDVSAHSIKTEIDALDVDTINVYINSYGGEVAEALAIYSTLKRNKAKVKTYCDGFACSAATIIFAAGDERIMGSIALLMVHNCMSYVGYANSEELRKAAEDNDKINGASIEAYKSVVNVSEEEIKALMDNETWLTAKEALEMGFATEIADAEESEEPAQSARQLVRDKILAAVAKEAADTKEDRILDKLDEVLKAVQRGDDPEQGDALENSGEGEPDPAPAKQKAAIFFNALSR